MTSSDTEIIIVSGTVFQNFKIERLAEIARQALGCCLTRKCIPASYANFIMSRPHAMYLYFAMEPGNFLYPPSKLFLGFRNGFHFLEFSLIMNRCLFLADHSFDPYEFIACTHKVAG